MIKQTIGGPISQEILARCGEKGRAIAAGYEGTRKFLRNIKDFSQNLAEICYPFR